MESLIIYILMGALIGFLSGIFGIGGSLISTPILKLVFGIPDLIALASPLPVTIPTAISGSYGYWKKGVIRKDIAKGAIIGGLPAVIVGALSTKAIASSWLMVLTGIFVIVVGLRLLVGKRLKESEEIERKLSIPVYSALIGIVAGTFSGLLAVGGGIILVPGFILLLGLTMQEAASTSLVCIAFYAIPGTIVHCMLGHIDWHLVFSLSIGVIPASYLGSKVGMAAKSDILKIIFSIFLILFGIYFIFRQFS